MKTHLRHEQWTCPVCGSLLTVQETQSGVIADCAGGCDLREILAALDLGLSDLFDLKQFFLKKMFNLK